MKLITEENFFKATFTNNERDLIEVLVHGEGEDELVSIAVEVDEDSELFQELMEVTNLDAIEKATLDWIEYERQAIEAFHIQLIKDGKVDSYVDRDIENEAFGEVLRGVLGLDEVNEEHLFRIKLQIFENQEIIDAPTDVKENIRTAETVYDVIRIAREYLDNL
jgi:DNA-binding protein YbaB